MSTAWCSTARRARVAWSSSSLVFACLLGTASCDEPRASPAEMEVVDVPVGRVVLGFASGSLRNDADVGAFRMARFPVTRGEYAGCVEAGACSASACEVEVEGNGAARPMECASVAQAARFCRWVSGSLPTLTQWLRAARGEAPHRFAWGDALPTCEQHPWAGASLAARSGVEDAMYGNGAPRCILTSESLDVGKHPVGASPHGLEDVLLTPTELVRGVHESPHAACASDAHCVVYGLESGAIDSVATVVGDTGSATGMGFRCAWEH